MLYLDNPVVIDEVQRIPTLFNEVHRLIESKNEYWSLHRKSLIYK